MHSVSINKLEDYMVGQSATPAMTSGSWTKSRLTPLSSASVSSNAFSSGGGSSSKRRPRPQSPSRCLIKQQSDLSPVNPYQVLQVRRDATQSEIKHAYKRLALWHHPGRYHGNEPNEAERRQRLFKILAACCESLLEKESRSRCDELLSQLEMRAENNRSLSTSGRTADSSRLRSAIIKTGVTLSPLPSLSRASSESDDDSSVGNHTEHNCTVVLPDCGALLGESVLDDDDHDEDDGHAVVDPISVLSPLPDDSSSSQEEAYQHYSAKDTDRLFGGPLALLYRARNWKKFTDPFVFFENVFGSAVLPASPGGSPDYINSTSFWNKSDNNLSSPLVSSPPRRSSAWTGSSETLENGDVVYKTRRILHNRVLTKTETITLDSKTGQKRSYVTVTSEESELTSDDPTEEFQAKTRWGLCNVDQFITLKNSGEKDPSESEDFSSFLFIPRSFKIGDENGNSCDKLKYFLKSCFCVYSDEEGLQDIK